MAIPNEAIGPTTLAITIGIGTFKDFLPPISDVRAKSATADPGFASDVRMGEVAAMAMLVGVGAIASYIAGDKHPLIIALVTGSFLVCMYESILRSNPMTHS